MDNRLTGALRTLRAHEHATDFQSPSRRLGEAPGRCGRGHRHARPNSASRACTQVRPAELADKSGNRCCGRYSMNPWSKTKAENGFLSWGPVPKPLGFTALEPEWLLLGRLTPPRHSGAWVSARVASLRCLILRPGENSINCVARRKKAQKKILQNYRR